MRAARALEEMPRVAEALSRGEISTAATDALVRAREAAPDAFARVEDGLVERARSLSHRDLRAELERWRLDVDADRAARDEQERLARRRFTAVPAIDGMVRTEGELDAENGQYLVTALRAKVDAWARTMTDDLRTPAQRRADALGEICREWLDLAERPGLGGERPHVVVTMDLAALEARAGGRASLEDVGVVTAESARRLACDASVTRVITDARSVPLEVGRTTKVVSPSLRRALAVRDGGCAFPGCERPPGWCDAHHVTHWADGGETGLSNLGPVVPAAPPGNPPGVRRRDRRRAARVPTTRRHPARGAEPAPRGRLTAGGSEDTGPPSRPRPSPCTLRRRPSEVGGNGLCP